MIDRGELRPVRGVWPVSPLKKVGPKRRPDERRRDDGASGRRDKRPDDDVETRVDEYV